MTGIPAFGLLIMNLNVLIRIIATLNHNADIRGLCHRAWLA
ncbi:hypothetical protein BN130_2146 [Cronobacter malonaticus 507]|nr:hypothetical protein BN130_2146 [Cronobacter malonaticus 507]